LFVEYRAILKEKLIQKQKSLPAFSLRSFAKKAGISQSMLSQVLHGNRNLSKKSAIKLVELLPFNGEESDFFISLVEYQTASSIHLKKHLFENICKNHPKTDVYEIQIDQFKIIADWYHIAILELTRLDKFVPSITYIANKLELSKLEATQAVDRLQKQGLLIEKNNRWVKSNKIFETPANISNVHIREYHNQMLVKAVEALKDQSANKRDFSGMTIAINQKQLPMVREKIKAFKKELSQCLNQDPDKDQVYQLNIQFFSLT